MVTKGGRCGMNISLVGHDVAVVKRWRRSLMTALEHLDLRIILYRPPSVLYCILTGSLKVFGMVIGRFGS